MTAETFNLDDQRGMAAQKATEIRRRLAEVRADELKLRAAQEELEAQLVATPAATWSEAAEKACYLLGIFAATPAARDPRRQKLIEALLADFNRLNGKP